MISLPELGRRIQKHQFPLLPITSKHLTRAHLFLCSLQNYYTVNVNYYSTENGLRNTMSFLSHLLHNIFTASQRSVSRIRYSSNHALFIPHTHQNPVIYMSYILVLVLNYCILPKRMQSQVDSRETFDPRFHRFSPIRIRNNFVSYSNSLHHSPKQLAFDPYLVTRDSFRIYPVLI